MCRLRGLFVAAFLLTACAPQPDPLRRSIDELLLAHAADALDDRARAQVAQAVLEAEAEFGVPALLILAVIERESRFDPAAIGPRGGRGLLQVRWETGRAVGGRLGLALEDADDLFDPRINIRLGSAYLARMHERFGDWQQALTAFNMGPTRLRRLQAQRPTASSPYSRRVVGRYEAWRATLEAEPAPAKRAPAVAPQGGLTPRRRS